MREVGLVDTGSSSMALETAVDTTILSQGSLVAALELSIRSQDLPQHVEFA